MTEISGLYITFTKGNQEHLAFKPSQAIIDAQRPLLTYFNPGTY